MQTNLWNEVLWANIRKFYFNTMDFASPKISNLPDVTLVSYIFISGEDVGRGLTEITYMSKLFVRTLWLLSPYPTFSSARGELLDRKGLIK